MTKYILVYFNYGTASIDDAGSYAFDKYEDAKTEMHHIFAANRKYNKGRQYGEERHNDALADIEDAPDKLWMKIIKVSGDNLDIDWLKEGGLIDPETKFDFKQKKGSK